MTVNQTRSTLRLNITGAISGKRISVISIQSRKNPRIKAVIKTTITTPCGPYGSPVNAVIMQDTAKKLEEILFRKEP